MCRWAAYIGEPTYLEDIVTAPSHSLIDQSHHALEAKTPTNGDGFGIAWYGDRAEPGTYRDILPAWSDPNLKSLCRQIRSPLFLAHVRASTGGATSRSNCHPFTAGRWAFMHNGQIGGFDRLRRRLESTLPDAIYDRMEGSTDSELFFLLMQANGLDDDPRRAGELTAAQIVGASQEVGVQPHLRLTCAFSDGENLYGIRYATDAFAPTLYIGEPSGGRCLVSEPYDKEKRSWRSVPAGSFVTLSPRRMAREVKVDPFVPAIEWPLRAVS